MAKMLQVLVLIYSIILMSDTSEALKGDEVITRFFQYFQAEEPAGIPVANFDEPAILYSPLEMVPVSLINGTLLGHSNITFVQVMVNMISMTGSVKATAPRLELEGDYEWAGLVQTSKGFLNCTLQMIDSHMNFTMALDKNHTLQISDIMIEADFEDVVVNMTNLRWEQELYMSTSSIQLFFHDIVQEVFRQTKPMVLEMINGELSTFISTLPSAIPVSTEVAQVDGKGSLSSFLQRFIRFLELDPLRLPERKSSVLGVEFKVTDLVLQGISVMSEIKTLLLVYYDKQMYIESVMVYPKLLLSYKVAVNSVRIVNFDIAEKRQLNNVELRIKLLLDPSLKHPPLIKGFHIDVGSVGRVESTNRGFFGTIRRFFTNIPDSIRGEIIEALSGLIRNMIQSELQKVNLKESLLEFVREKEGKANGSYPVS